MSRTIDFYFDFLSPYGYLAAGRIDAVAARHGRSVTWRPFLVGVPVMTVMGLKPLMETPLKSDYVLKDIFRLASLFGVPLNRPSPRSTHSRSAARAYYWLDEHHPDLARPFAHAVFKRMWVDGEDITDVAALCALAGALGADAKAVEDGLNSEPIRARLTREVADAIDRGVFGSPFFIADEEPFWGVDRLDMLEHWLGHGSWSGRETA